MAAPRRVVSAKQVLGLLRQVLAPAGSWSSESAYHRELEAALNGLVNFDSKKRTSNGMIPDLVIHSAPTVVVEIKPTGDWRYVGQAAAQLYNYCSNERSEARKVAAFGTRIDTDALRLMLDRLGIEAIEPPKP
jgi:hypothetical protein